LSELNKGEKVMKLFKQLPQIISEKALKMSTYRKLAIALLAIVLWVVPAASSFASINSVSQGIVNSATVQFPVENIMLRQLDLGESTNLLAYVSDDEMDVASLFSNFQKALDGPDKKQSLYKVCQDSNYNRTKCFALLSFFLTSTKTNLIQSCYKPGINGKLCLDIALRKLGVKLENFDDWSQEFAKVS
jgi:hypothetical protein